MQSDDEPLVVKAGSSAPNGSAVNGNDSSALSDNDDEDVPLVSVSCD